MGNENKDMTLLQKLDKFLTGREDKFLSFNEGGINKLNFAAECDFARQAIAKNDYLINVARNNPQSLADAICNVAAIGITLNPAEKLAYLIPRKTGYDSIAKKDIYSVCLDLSYMGLIKLSTDSGVVKYMKAEIIREGDKFKYYGFDKRPDLEVSDPFNDEVRGEKRGVIAWAKTADGDYLCEIMSIKEINNIRDKSESYKHALSKGKNSWQYKNCVWVDPVSVGEMQKKTVIKRLYKTLPKSSGNSKAMSEAIDMMNSQDRLEFSDFNKEPKSPSYAESEYVEYKRCVDDGDFIGLLCMEEKIGQQSSTDLCSKIHDGRWPNRGKTKYFELLADNLKVARELRESNLETLIDTISRDDSIGAVEIIEDCNNYELDWYCAKLNNEQEQYLRGLV